MAWTVCDNQVLETVKCWCGAVFAVSGDAYRIARESGKALYCPATGHMVVWEKSEATKLREEADRLRASLTAERDRNEALRQEVQHQEKRVVTYRGHITRIKNRIHAGVCIHCNRTFSDLARHMKCKHDEVLS